jgi:hypothetical protein
VSAFILLASFMIFDHSDGFFKNAGPLLRVFNTWSWILAITGYGSAYLNRNNKTLEYANQAVYPFYILHQTITIIIGYYLMNVNWGLFPKGMLMVLVTFGASFLIYEFLIRRIGWMRPLFGLKRAISPIRKTQERDASTEDTRKDLR